MLIANVTETVSRGWPYENAIVTLIVCVFVAYGLPRLASINSWLFKFETTNALDTKISLDIVTKENLAVRIDQIDHDCRMRSRAAVASIFRKHLKQCPDAQLLLFHARIPISTRVSDNHLAREFVGGVKEYTQRILHECFIVQPRWLSDDESEILKSFVKEWIAAIVDDVRQSVIEKQDAYQEALANLKMSVNVEICQKKIDKNLRYLAVLSTLDTFSVTKILEESAITQRSEREL